MRGLPPILSQTWWLLVNKLQCSTEESMSYLFFAFKEVYCSDIYLACWLIWLCLSGYLNGEEDSFALNSAMWKFLYLRNCEYPINAFTWDKICIWSTVFVAWTISYFLISVIDITPCNNYVFHEFFLALNLTSFNTPWRTLIFTWS